ncbi:MAG: pyruvate, phosphate dikinase [Proteobacteria bacterium]|nr:MAG: pyruvate, phosphate dikinase [Pseudomonadota bacterium]
MLELACSQTGCDVAMDGSADLGSNRTRVALGTKAETLARLKPLLSKSRILDLVYFTASEWRADERALLRRIRESFAGCRLAIRSSALIEDTSDASMAGAFETRLGVPCCDVDAIRDAVLAVLASYQGDPANQVLVQPQFEGSSVAGVVTTRDVEFGVPYYVVTYDDQSDSTSSVTAGAGDVSTLRVHRAVPDVGSKPPFLSALIHAVREIERVLDRSDLDIEFAMDGPHSVVIFQVRLLATKRTWKSSTIADVSRGALALRSTIGALLDRRDAGIHGSRTALSNMADWNPAEMLGATPRPLAISLYRRLITQGAWQDARRWVGYQRMPRRDLMVIVSGRPYIDVRLSLNSFLPQGAGSKASGTLVEEWISRLSVMPDQHDKIEFAVALTCLDFSWRDRLASHPESCAKMDRFVDALRSLTARALDTTAAGSLAQAEDAIRPLAFSSWSSGLPSREHASAARIEALLRICEARGTRPFAVLARHAFIAESFLRSARERGAISPERTDAFRRSLATVSQRMARDSCAVLHGHLAPEAFVADYGHLRPSTYDINSPPLANREPAEFMPTSARDDGWPEPFHLTNRESRGLSLLLRENGLAPRCAEQLLAYAHRSITGREHGKFLFTRVVNEILETIAFLAERKGATRDAISHLTVQSILDLDTHTDASRLADLVQAGRRLHEVARATPLPSAIFAATDVDVVLEDLATPTFVGSQTVSGEVAVLSPLHSPGNICGKIVAIEQADPGYDWIFPHGPIGLVTRFGGANSHMAIRCVEHGLAAAIGCGERAFTRIARSHRAVISPATQSLMPLDAG